MTDRSDASNPLPGEPVVLHRIAIRVPEFVRVHELRLLLGSDERAPIGHVRLHTVNGRRCWDVTDSYRAARLTTEDDDRDYDLLIPPSMLMYGQAALGDGNSTEICSISLPDGSRQLVLTGSGGSMTIDDRGMPYPDLDAIISLGEIGAHATLRLDQLMNFAVTSRFGRHELAEDDDVPPYLLTLHDNQLSAEVDWFECGISRYTLSVNGSGGPVSLLVSPHFFESIVFVLGSDDEIEVNIEFPAEAGRPIRFHGPDVEAWLMPIRRPDDIESLRQQVESVITEVSGHLSTQRDDDGDYPLRRYGAPIYGRLVNGSPSVFQVFAVVLRDIEATEELLAELNDLNASIGFARLFHVGQQVLAEVDIVAATIDPTELSTALDRIVQIAERVSPTLEVVFGGSATRELQTLRWQGYRTMVVDAEVTPGTMSQLNGAGAVGNWPFPGPVYVLTAWNPQGVPLGDDAHESIHLQLANDILKHGGRFVHGVGRSPDGSHSEPSLVAWDISREVARVLGWRANQDTVAEIDAHNFRLLSCQDDQQEEWGRLD